VLFRSLPETPEGTLSTEAFESIGKMDFDALALGPGISLNSATSDLVIKLVSSINSPMVIDADGLWALSCNPGVLLKAKAPVILTPHPGEMARLTSLDIKQIKREPLEIARDFACKWNVFIILKFATTIIATPDGNIYVNPTGNPGMASGGSGDVLTGMIGSFLAQGVSPLYSCLLGTFLHGLSGDLASLEIEEEAMIAGDLIDYISPALKKFKEYFPGENLDTDNFVRPSTQNDINAFRYLYPFANLNLIKKIESSEMTRQTLAGFRTAMENLTFLKDKAFIHMGRVNDPDILVIIADFFLKMVEATWCIVSGVYGQKLIVIFRNAGFRLNAGSTAQALFGQWGSAGGHTSTARAEVPLQEIGPDVKETELREWILEKLKTI